MVNKNKNKITKNQTSVDIKSKQNDKKIKITKHNVFDILDGESENKQTIVDRKISKLLSRATNSKRRKDEFASLKNSENAIIEVKNVSKHYLSGNVVTKVLKNINLTINKGEFVVIFGKSGGGKTTLLNLISGLDRPSKGDIIVCNHNLPYLSDSKLTLFRRKNVSFIFQNYNLLQNLSGYDNVETGGFLQKNKEKKLNIDELFEIFELEDVKLKYPSQMSGGQQQRISVLRALAKNADIIFADEPTGALDEKTTEIVLTTLYDINQKFGTTIIVVTHNPAMDLIANKIVTVNGGKIKSIKINKNPIHPSKMILKNI